jgi:hypothetical protein
MEKYVKPSFASWGGGDLQEILGPAENQYCGFHVVSSIPANGGAIVGDDIRLICDDPVDPASLAASDVLLAACADAAAAAGAIPSSSSRLGGHLTVSKEAVTTPIDVTVSLITTYQTNDTIVIDPVSPLAAGTYCLTIPAAGQEVMSTEPESLCTFNMEFTVPGPTPTPGPTATPTPEPTPTPTPGPTVATLRLDEGQCVTAAGGTVVVPVWVILSNPDPLCYVKLKFEWDKTVLSCFSNNTTATDGFEIQTESCTGGKTEEHTFVRQAPCQSNGTGIYHVADVVLNVDDPSGSTNICFNETSFEISSGTGGTPKIPIVGVENSCYNMPGGTPTCP